MTTSYTPPRHPLQVLQKLDFDEPVPETDPRFVDLDQARGDVRVAEKLARWFQLDLKTGAFFPNERKHVLLYGPVGSGKSTELLRFAQALRKTGKVFPVLLNTRGEVDINNLQYADVLMALATALTRELSTAGIDLPRAALEPLREWFVEHVQNQEKTRELAMEVQSEVGAEFSVPYLFKLCSRLTARFKNSSIYKDQLREVIQKSFSQFAAAFNDLVRSAEAALNAAGQGERVLLIVDGTDKIPRGDAERLFVDDSEQLLAIRALVLYTAPISLRYAGSGRGKLEAAEILPIVKLQERTGERYEPGWCALRDLLALRVDPAIFTAPELMDELIAASGGHPRELLRLLQLACHLTQNESIDVAVVAQALDKAAADYRYWLGPEDYALLAAVDQAGGAHDGNDERTRTLLNRLALLHYNDGSWRASNPLVRRLEGYTKALQALGGPDATAPA